LYAKDNLVVIIAGNISNVSNLQEQIGELFASLPEKKTGRSLQLLDHFPSEHTSHSIKNTQQNHLVIGIPGYDMHQTERFGAKMLAILLGGTMSSRLFQEIREKRGLCYYVSASHSTDDQDGTFIIRAGMEKARREKGLQALYEELEKIANGKIAQAEINMALGNLTGKTKVGLETSDEVAQFIGKQRLFKKHIDLLDDLLKQYHLVTLDQIQKIAEKFTQDNLYAYRIE